MANPIMTEDYRMAYAVFNHKNPASMQYGHEYVEQVKNYKDELLAESVLDWGCGQGTLKFHYFDRYPDDDVEFNEYDPAVYGKCDKRPEKADLVTCINVLEHVEPKCIKWALLEAYNRCLKGCFIVISLKKRENLELKPEVDVYRTIQGGDWWIKRIKELKYLKIKRAQIVEDEVWIWLEK